MEMDRNKLITKLQNLTKSGRRPRTSPGLVIVIIARSKSSQKIFSQQVETCLVIYSPDEATKKWDWKMSHQTFAILLIFYKISFLCCVHCVTPGGHHDVNNLQIVNNVLNANFECPSNATAASISAAKSAKPVFEVADCDASQSRWDYNFQVNF